MTDIRYKPDLTAAFVQLHTDLADTIATMPRDQFDAPGRDGRWSPNAYLRHILLSFKPIVKALEMTPDKVRKAFPVAESSQRSYDDIVSLYKAGLARGVRAESQPSVLPESYRLPDDMTDERAYLLDQWHNACQRFAAALELWDESDLESAQLPHPVIGLIPMREMLYFTHFHTALHHDDMRGIHL
jgi:hypothetical protein